MYTYGKQVSTSPLSFLCKQNAFVSSWGFMYSWYSPSVFVSGQIHFIYYTWHKLMLALAKQRLPEELWKILIKKQRLQNMVKSNAEHRFSCCSVNTETLIKVKGWMCRITQKCTICAGLFIKASKARSTTTTTTPYY